MPSPRDSRFVADIAVVKAHACRLCVAIKAAATNKHRLDQRIRQQQGNTNDPHSHSFVCRTQPTSPCTQSSQTEIRNHFSIINSRYPPCKPALGQAAIRQTMKYPPNVDQHLFLQEVETMQVSVCQTDTRPSRNLATGASHNVSDTTKA